MSMTGTIAFPACAAALFPWLSPPRSPPPLSGTLCGGKRGRLPRLAGPIPDAVLSAADE